MSSTVLLTQCIPTTTLSLPTENFERNFNYYSADTTYARDVNSYMFNDHRFH